MKKDIKLKKILALNNDGLKKKVLDQRGYSNKVKKPGFKEAKNQPYFFEILCDYLTHTFLQWIRMLIFGLMVCSGTFA